MKLKRMLAFFLSTLILLNLAACGGGGASASGGSKIKEHYVFYTKDDGTYYTNGADIKETKLSDSGVLKFLLDEIRKQIIYADLSDFAIYIMPLDGKGERIKIYDEAYAITSIDNRYIIIVNNDGHRFLYDLEKNERIADLDDSLSIGMHEDDNKHPMDSKFVRYQKQDKLWYLYDLESKKTFDDIGGVKAFQFENNKKYVYYKIDDLWYLYDLENRKKVDGIGASNGATGINDDTTAVGNVKDRNLYAYNLETGENTLLNENGEFVTRYIGDQFLTWTELDTTSNKNILYSYNLETKEKKKTELGVYFDYCSIDGENNALWYTVKNEVGNTLKTTLYRVVVGESPKIVYQLSSRTFEYLGPGLKTYRDAVQVKKLSVTGDGGGTYFSLDHDMPFDFTEELKNGRYFYADKLGNVSSIDKQFRNKSDYSVEGFDICVCYDDGFAVGATIYDGEINGVSSDKKLLYYTNQDTSYVLDLVSGETKQLAYPIGKTISSIPTNDNDHLLYFRKPIGDEPEFVFDDTIVGDSFMSGYTAYYGNKGVEVSYDYSTFYSMKNKELLMYKDYKLDSPITVSQNVDSCYTDISSGILYYISEGNLYSHDGKESKKIADTVEQCKDFYSLR